MNSKTIRFFQLLLIALFLVTGMVTPAHAQTPSQTNLVGVRLLMQDGWTALGRHAVAADFVIVCPTKEVLDPTHPCSNASGASVQPTGLGDLVLVCPIKEVLDPSHPCAERRSQVIRATPDDFVLVCPIKEVLDPGHPCAQTNSASVQFKIPGDYVMTCPVKEVLEPGHPCAERNQGSQAKVHGPIFFESIAIRAAGASYNNLTF